MSKNPNKSKPVKRDEPMNGAMKFFLAGCVAELYLLIIRRFYVNGKLEQVVAWDGYLMALVYLGLAALAAGAILGLVWSAPGKRRVAGGCLLAVGAVIAALALRAPLPISAELRALVFVAGVLLLVISGAVALWSAGKKNTLIAWALLGTGGFLAAASMLARTFVGPAVTLLCVAVPVAMLLGILWVLYDRECAWSLTIMGVSLLALWVCRREMSSIRLGAYVKAGAVVAILVLAAAAFLAHRASGHGGRLGKLQVLPADADVLPIYVACGLSAAALVTALISATVAYYAMWAMALVVFALAVYYTVKQL